MKKYSFSSKLPLLALLVMGVCYLFATSSGYALLLQALPDEGFPLTRNVKNTSTPLKTTAISASSVTCTPWQDLSLGTGTGSSTYDECAPDTVIISTNAITAANATSDNQEIVFQELCGNGEMIAKVASLSGGYAGLFIRESNATGSRRASIMTQLGASVQRQIRSITNQFYLSANITASGHQWLKITRSGTQVSASWSTNGTSWNLAYFTSLGMTDCVSIGMAAYSTSGSTINATFTNISVAQSDTIPSTEVAFADSTLSAQSGDTVQICVNLQNPCYCSPVSVDVALTSDSLPHFIDYEPQTLTFSEGDTVQCFSVVLPASDSSKNYTFELSNLTGGNDSELGAISTLTLEVEGGEEEEAAFGLCGSFNKSSSSIVDSTEISFYDRFGNLYLLEELLIPSGGGSCGCDEFEGDIPYQNENYFMLYFEDCLAPGPPKGFADPELGLARRRATCRAFAQLAHSIQHSENPCAEGTYPPVNIRVLADADLSEETVAAATPYFDYRILLDFPFGGIIDGLPWKIINNGGYAIPENQFILNEEEFIMYEGFHGAFAVNFDDFGFYTGDATPPDDGDDFHDLYTVILHEGLHILGFLSLINPDDGDHKLPLTKSYGRFDTHLKLSTGSSVVARDGSDPYRWNLNIAAEDLHKSCQNATVSGPDMVFGHPGGNDFPIFTGPPGESPGRAFSHLNDNCDGESDEFLMNVELFPETRIEMGAAERRILCQLGYRLPGMENCSCTVAGAHDFTQLCSEAPIRLNLCDVEEGTFVLPYSMFLDNDTGADGIEYLKLVMGFAEVEDMENGTIRLVSCSPNPGPGSNISLIYTPVSSTCAIEGSPVRVDIQIHPCVGCENYLSETPLPESSNPCNLVCNPEIIAYDHEGEEVEEDFIAINCNPTICHELPGWYAATITPDYLTSPNVSGNSGSLRFRSQPGNVESVFTPLSLEGGRYFLSFYGGEKKETDPQPEEAEFTIEARLVSSEITAQFQLCEHTSITSEDGLDLMEGDLLVIGEGEFPYSNPVNFSRAAACFEVQNNNPYDALWFYPVSEPDYVVESYIDNIEVIPDNFDLGENPSPLVFGCSTDLGKEFCMLSDVTIHYEWFEEVDNTLVSIMAYNVLNGVATADDPEDPDNDNFDFDAQILTVTPNQTTTYVLQRSLVTPNNLPAGFELCTTEDEVIVEVEEEMPGLSLASENCGLVTFSATGILPGHIWSIDYGNGITGTSLVHNYTLTPDTYTATLTVTNDCGTIEIPLEVAIEGCPELDCCPNTSSMLLVNTSISDAIEAGLPSGGTSLDLCIEGILTIDENYSFSGNLFMGPDARIVVTSEATLELDGAHLQGCDFLWQGISVSQPHINNLPSLIIHNETVIEDAKLAVAALPQVQLEIRETTFDRNYIGLYLAGVSLSGFYGNTFDCTDALKPSFSSAPNIGDYSYAGIQSRGGTLHIGVTGTTVNTFQNLRNGIINVRGPLTVENSVFRDIEKAPGEPYDITGYGIHHQGTIFAPLDQRGFGYDTNATLTFDNCYSAIWASQCNVKVRFNRMADIHTGIQAQYCKNANINIDHNRISCYRTGISLLQNDPANSIAVWGNHLYVNENSPTNAVGTGIGVHESGSQQFNAVIEQNPVYLYRKGRGISLNTVKGYTVRDNDVFLESTIVNDAMGIVMEDSKSCRVSCNDIIGVGKGEGLVSRTTSATLYSCNTVENLNIGASFDEASGSTYLQTTEFVPPLSKGLLYKTNIAMMPVQSHRGNRWNTGTYGVAAAMHEGSGDFFYFNTQRFEIHTTSAPYYPPSISLTGASPSSWFAFTGTSPFSTCNPTVECPVLGFVPDKDEVKSREEQLAGDEFAGAWPGGLHWAAQWQLYEMLERSPGIRDTSTVMDTYYTGKGTGALGRLHALQKDIDTLFQVLPEQQDTLQQYIEQTESLMEALALADSMAVHAPLLATPGLPQQLLAQCDSLLRLSETLVDEIFDARAAIVDTLFTQNAAIADTAIYIVNEKVVNEIYLSTLQQDSLALDTLQTDTLYAIAMQCPETGGPAVYRARSLYALIAMVDFDTINCQSVAPLQSPPQQALAQLPDKQANFHVFPNPNQGRFTVAYELEQDGMLVLTDILGRQAATASLLADARRKEVSASELKAGLYYLHILSGNGELLYSNRIIIIH